MKIELTLQELLLIRDLMKTSTKRFTTELQLKIANGILDEQAKQPGEVSQEEAEFFVKRNS